MNTYQEEPDGFILFSDSHAGQAYSDLVERFLGKDLPHRFLDVKRKGIFSKLFGG